MHAEIHNEYEQGKLNNMAYIGVDDRRLTTDENIFQKQTYSSKAIEVYRSSWYMPSRYTGCFHSAKDFCLDGLFP